MKLLYHSFMLLCVLLVASCVQDTADDKCMTKDLLAYDGVNPAARMLLQQLDSTPATAAELRAAFPKDKLLWDYTLLEQSPVYGLHFTVPVQNAASQQIEAALIYAASDKEGGNVSPMAFGQWELLDTEVLHNEIPFDYRYLYSAEFVRWREAGLTVPTALTAFADRLNCGPAAYDKHDNLFDIQQTRSYTLVCEIKVRLTYSIGYPYPTYPGNPITILGTSIMDLCQNAAFSLYKGQVTIPAYKHTSRDHVEIIFLFVAPQDPFEADRRIDNIFKEAVNLAFYNHRDRLVCQWTKVNTEYQDVDLGGGGPGGGSDGGGVTGGSGGGGTIEPPYFPCPKCFQSPCRCPKQEDCENISVNAGRNEIAANQNYDRMWSNLSRFQQFMTYQHLTSHEYGMALNRIASGYELTDVKTSQSSNHVTIPIGPETCAIIHNHPGETPPSSGDAWQLIFSQQEYSQFTDIYVDAGDYNYCLHIEDRTAAINYAKKTGNYDAFKAGFHKEWVDLSTQFHNNYKYSSSDAQFYALSYLLSSYNTGVVALRQYVDGSAGAEFKQSSVSKDPTTPTDDYIVKICK